VTGTSGRSVTIAWSGVGGATDYLIQASLAPDFPSVVAELRVPGSYRRMSLNGLLPGTDHHLRVRADAPSGAGRWSRVVAATTLPDAGVPLRVATYNVLDPALDASVGPWGTRRVNLAHTIDSVSPDVVFLEEAGWSRLPDGATPASDLAGLAAGNWRVSSAGDSPAVEDSAGERILYRAGRFAPIRSGRFLLPRVRADRRRSAVWQEFQEVVSGARFLTVATHLSHGTTHNRGRARQARGIVRRLRRINRERLPVVITGDLNSFDGRADVTPMSVFAAAGYIDAGLAAPETDTPLLNTVIAARSPRGRIRIDHIAVSTSIAVLRFSIANPPLPGPASDHRLVWADVAIPASREGVAEPGILSRLLTRLFGRARWLS
jgi:endonuclease/exonuclease/phosphatase family metal-dependent hydrolase